MGMLNHHVEGVDDVEEDDGSMFRPKSGTFWVASADDPRWNRTWRVNWLCSGGMIPAAEEWIELKKKELGNPPEDLEYGFMKD